jgi:hypothetical protein
MKASVLQRITPARQGEGSTLPRPGSARALSYHSERPVHPDAYGFHPNQESLEDEWYV